MFKTSVSYLINILKWICLSLVVGVICGLAGVLFHYSVDLGTHFREQHPAVLLALPLAGVLIVLLYHVCKMDNDRGTNNILDSVRSSGRISTLIAPVIIISTALTHLCGGSAGREGAALQIGGSISSCIARIFKLKSYNTAVMLMCGMSAVFSAVFGTPLTAAVFSLEVASVGVMHYGALFPAVLSAIVAQGVAHLFGVEKTAFTIVGIPELGYASIGRVLIVASLTAVVSILFIVAMHEGTKLFAKHVPNKYIRIILGAFAVIALTFLVGNTDYNGAGMNIIINAVENGSAHPLAFLLKIIFTVVTLSVGFKGGEIVPSFFIGSTFGVLVGPLVGLNPSFSAAIGLIALFCGVVNCPIASIILSIELFGAEGLLYFSIAAALSYALSGNYSLYSSQKILFSKLHATEDNN